MFRMDRTRSAIEMSSVARICMKAKEGIESIQVFFDGDPTNLGPQMLLLTYREATELMSHGNIRSLENGKAEPCKGDKIGSLMHSTMSDLMKSDTQAYYFYLLDGADWYFQSRNTTLFKLSDWLASDLKNKVNI